MFLTLIPIMSLWAYFINICAQHFLLSKFNAFFGAWQLANSTQTWQILCHKFDEFSCALWGRMFVKLNGEFFAKVCVLALFRLVKKFGEIDPRSLWLSLFTIHLWERILYFVLALVVLYSSHKNGKKLIFMIFVFRIIRDAKLLSWSMFIEL